MNLDRRPVSDPVVDLGLRQRPKFNFFSEYGHLAYQSKGTDACSNMVANILVISELKSEAVYDPHCFKMTEVTIIQNFEQVRLLLSRALDNSV